MDKIINFFKENIKLVIGICILSVLLIILVPIIKNSNNKPKEPIVENESYELVLFGEEKIDIKQGEIYQEPGYYALYNGKLVTEEVDVEEEINTDLPGVYEIVYRINNIVKKRKVEVLKIDQENDDNENNDKNNNKSLNIVLIGESKITLYVGDTYKELGAKATYGNEDISNNIQIKQSINTSVPGTYKVIYTIKYEKEIKEIVREVVVEASIKNNLTLVLRADTNTLTNNSVYVSFNVSGDNYSYLKYPNDTVTRNSSGKYEINKNGTYRFYAYDKNGNYRVESITINNIDKTPPTGVCKAISSTDKTVINVTAYDINGIDKYIYNSNYTSPSPTYTISRKLTEAYVKIQDKVGNEKVITCELEHKNENKISNLEIHFIAGVSDDDIILIRTNDKTIMIDGGQYDGRTKVVNYLKNLGISKIDTMIGSHVHWNHVQAQAAILQNFKVDNLYYSVDILNCVSLGHCKSDDNKYIKDEIIKQNKNPKILKAGDYLKIGDMELYFIGPTRGKLTTYQNANSLVFILKHGNKKYMFTGDTPSEYMDVSKFNANISKFNMSLDVDVFKWPHHGYETLTDELFKNTTPEYVIIPGSSNHPSSSDRKLLDKYNVKYYHVLSYKSVILMSDGNKITVRTISK